LTKFPSPEYEILESLKPQLNFRRSRRYPFPIGDDAAIRTGSAGERLVLTADSFVENVHFSFEYMTAPETGYKAMAINLSDCAAMGALPDGALVQIIFPKAIHRKDFEKTMTGLYAGFHEACMQWNFAIIGGNLAAGPCWIIDITLIGRIEKGLRYLPRDHAKNNDGLWVSGAPGESGAGLACLEKWGNRRKVPAEYDRFVARHVRPAPRIGLGIALAKDLYVHAAIDISDGVSKECHTLAYENKLGIMISLNDGICSKTMKRLGALLRVEWLEWFFNGGEDYELLFAASRSFNPSGLRKKLNVPLIRIGTFTKAVKGVWVSDPAGPVRPLEKGGWDHLRNALPK
jgi:thiamine-monophosphate kinase